MYFSSILGYGLKAHSNYVIHLNTSKAKQTNNRNNKKSRESIQLDDYSGQAWYRQSHFQLNKQVITKTISATHLDPIDGCHATNVWASILPGNPETLIQSSTTVKEFAQIDRENKALIKICTLPWAESKPDITTNRSRRRLESDCPPRAQDCIPFSPSLDLLKLWNIAGGCCDKRWLFIVKVFIPSSCWLSWRVYYVRID